MSDLRVLIATLVGTCLVPTPLLANDSGGPIGVPGLWERVFTDEFDGTSVDQSNWTACYWWDDDGCTNLGTNELQWYLPENIEVGDGLLRLIARREEAIGFEGRTFRYTSGIVTTGTYYEEAPQSARVSFRYGYFEIRAKVPSGQGLWPAIWMLPIDRESRPEIDIMEVLGHATNVLEMHFHFVAEDGERRSAGNDITSADLSLDWHVYGIEWRRDALIWYLDGVEVWRYEGAGIPDEEMYLLLNLAIGGDWPGPPSNDTRFPAEFLVDYVRVWQHGIPNRLTVRTRDNVPAAVADELP